MRSITGYIFRQLLVATIAITLVLTFAVWLTQSLRLIDYIVNRGLPSSTFFTFIVLLLPFFLWVVMPIAAFVAVLFVYNKLLNDRELVVLRAAGLSQLQLAKPAVMLGVVIMVAMLALSLYLLPLTYRDFKDLQYRLRNNYSTVLLQEGVFQEVVDGVTLFVRERSSDGLLEGLFVHDTRDEGNPVTMMADSGALVPSPEGPRVVMKDGNRQQFDRNTGRLSVLYFDSYTMELGKLQESSLSRWREPSERFLHELLAPPNSELDREHRSEMIAEAHNRVLMPIYGIGFVLIALAALLSGEFNRRGQTMRVVVAILCVGLVEAFALGFKDLAARLPSALIGMHASAFGTVLVSLYVLVKKPSRRRNRARIAKAGAA